MTESNADMPRWMHRLGIFWRVIVLVSFGFGIVSARQQNPALFSSWRGAAMLLLIGAFLAGYELYERTETRRGGHWPMPYRTVLLYLIFQLAIMGLLLQFGRGFSGPIFALMGQVCSSIPIRKWPVPLLAIIALAGAGAGLIEDISAANWGAITGFVFFMVLWIGIAVFISMLFHERFQREQLIAELRQTRDELALYAMQAEELAALRERTRLAREMHDSLGHALVVVNVKLEAAQRLYAVDAGRGDGELEATRALVRATMTELRRSLADLRAPLLDHHDLPAALARLAGEIRARTSLEVTCSAAPDLHPAGIQLAPEATESLWRVAREALSNVERHAAAGCATLTLERQNGSLILRVTDDGSGVAPADLARPGHYGITGMRERVEALGGTLRIAARPEGGTVVEARVPWRIEN
jgi:signal transduction histidine kinase